MQLFWRGFRKGEIHLVSLGFTSVYFKGHLFSKFGFGNRQIFQNPILSGCCFFFWGVCVKKENRQFVDRKSLAFRVDVKSTKGVPLCIPSSLTQCVCVCVCRINFSRKMKLTKNEFICTGEMAKW